MDILGFEKLDVWQLSFEYVKNCYTLINKFPKEGNYALCDQLRRSAVSVPSNIAEGTGRMSYKEKIHFLEIAFGSLMESYCQLRIAHELNYITEPELSSIKDQVFSISRMLNALRTSYVEKSNNL